MAVGIDVDEGNAAAAERNRRIASSGIWRLRIAERVAAELVVRVHEVRHVALDSDELRLEAIVTDADAVLQQRDVRKLAARAPSSRSDFAPGLSGPRCTINVDLEIPPERRRERACLQRRRTTTAAATAPGCAPVFQRADRRAAL